MTQRNKKTNGRGEKTRESILDAAEILFAERGYHGVTVREITKQAGVDTALAHYYFGSKLDLFDAVLTRRAQELNEARSEALDDCLRNAGPNGPTPEEIIDAFTHPLLERTVRGDAGWKAYFALIAHVNNSREWGRVLMTKHFDPLVRRFVSALKKALPDCAEEEVYWGYHFLSGALALSMAETGRIDNLSDGLCQSSDLGSIYERLPPFAAAGLKALAERGRKVRKSSPRAAAGKTARPRAQRTRSKMLA
jgi:AcrR family transcriptional regulator